jgi:hypothetical protein
MNRPTPALTPSHTLNARGLLHDPDIPPTLYVSPDVGDPTWAAVPPFLRWCGLPNLRLKDGTLQLVRARGEEWRTEVGSDRSVTVWAPFPRPDRRVTEWELITGITITDPADWCQAAVAAGDCFLIVGLPLPFRRGEITTFGWLLDQINGRTALAGIVPVETTA